MAGFRNPQAGCVEQPEQNVIMWFCFGGEHSTHVLLAQDPFRQAILIAGQRQFRGRIDRQVPHPDAEAEQAFDGGQRARPRDRSQARGHQELGEALQIGEGYAGEGLFRVIEKSFRIKAIAIACVQTRCFSSQILMISAS